MAVLRCLLLSLSLWSAAGAARAADTAAGDPSLIVGVFVTVDERVRGSVAAAGASVDIRARIDEDVQMAGARTRMSGVAGGNLAAAGGVVTLEPNSVVTGNAWLTGASVATAGQIGGTARVFSGYAVIGGDIAGDLEIWAGSVEVLPGTVVNGRLTYYSPGAARIDATARIVGGVAHAGTFWPAQLAGIAGVIAAVIGIGVAAAATLIALAVIAMFPNFTDGASAVIDRHPWPTLGLGLALLCGLPFASAFALLTVVGAPLAFVLLAVYALSLPLALLIGVLHVGRLGLRLVGRKLLTGTGWRFGALAIGMVLVALAGAIPWIGTLIPVAVLMFGLGAIYREVFRRWRAWIEPSSA